MNERGKEEHKAGKAGGQLIEWYWLTYWLIEWVN